MDPITALGVAGNVVQFLDFGRKLVYTSFEICKAPNGASASNKESEMLLKDFIESIDTVSADLLQYDNKLSLNIQQTPSSSGLQEIVDHCKALTVNLLARYENLKLHRKSGRWKSLMRAVKCMWKEPELQDLNERLIRYHSQLEWRVLLSLR